MILAEAVELVLGSKGIIILARYLKPAVEVRDGLLNALDRFTAERNGTSERPDLRP